MFRKAITMILLSCTALATVALADNGKSFACKRVCYVTSISCAKDDPHGENGQRCGLHRGDCENSCEVSAAGPSPAAALLRPKASSADLCRQNCALSRHSCIDGGNSDSVCETGHNACIDRCDIRHGQVELGRR